MIVRGASPDRSSFSAEIGGGEICATLGGKDKNSAAKRQTQSDS
jgi:hypothetical protein